MAGHSKWKNIQHRKGRQDAIRGKVFTKISKEIFAATRNGGDDPTTNARLRMAINKAKAANMPNDNIERTIKKALGELDGVTYEEIRYEGYGPSGVAVMVDVLTDNKNRSAAEVRHAFNKNGGNLGENGCVSFMFDRKGLLVIDREHVDVDEDEMLLEVIEAGADELETTEDVFEILTDPEEFEPVKTALEEQGYTFSTAEVTMLPQTKTELTDDDALKVLKLIETLEDNDDVQNVYHNLEAADDVYEKFHQG
ncbi:YebC/PmpR family DNA-binding transcriptional regulator [Desertibacillus haloalkaliphilus]|uniref:YebC/PmpR family DNA-binding transcriptional regulator n=1 Tax=Desertibacillus haloalkaliphilus TaxID=1328930 RepID=UPI001C25EC29|nr:YebC/PmpR family DNA-binding transcriptional regulator [Desertibacillus haloalkaliphilus]MBU8905490.1 YebC/PmpR family DNA-binding transcriptional regulator [Desertibacillus haloalkaliphilus]